MVQLAEVRQQVLQTVYSTLFDLINDPPRQVGQPGVPLNLHQVRQVINEIRPFWLSYLQAAKTESKTWTVNNMVEHERNKYLSCQWWFELLEERLKEEDSK
jgi:hypothetical protein